MNTLDVHNIIFITIECGQSVSEVSVLSSKIKEEADFGNDQRVILFNGFDNVLRLQTRWP